MPELKKIATAIVLIRQGIKVLDKPMAETYGAKVVRLEPCGARLDVYRLITVNTVPYALVDANLPLYVRVAEADWKTVYCEVIQEAQTDPLAAAVEHLALAVEKLAAK